MEIRRRIKMKVFNDNIIDTFIAIGSGQLAALYVFFNSNFIDIGFTLLRAFLIAFIAAIGSLFAKWLWKKYIK